MSPPIEFHRHPLKFALKVLLLSLFWSLSGHSIVAQTPDSILDENIRVFERFAAKRQPVLSLHLDKEIYNPGEIISYSSFAVDPGSDSVKTTTLHVALIDPANGISVAQDQFEMTIDRFSAGSLEVPDTVAEGQYVFVAYTNSMAHLSRIEPFRQAVTIKAASRDFFRISNVSVVRKPSQPDSLYWHARIITDSNGLASRGLFVYLVRGDGKVILSGRRPIDPFGEVELALPAKDSLIRSLMLSARVSRGLKSTKLSKAIDVTPHRINVAYFPESGNTVTGLPSRIVLCLHRNNGKAIHCSGILYEDSSEISSFETDLFGFATFYCKPVAGRKYWIQLDQQPPDTYLSGAFPTVKESGLVLKVGSGVVRDSVLLQIQSTQTGGQYRLLIYSASKTIYAGIVCLKKDWGLVKLSAAGWPAGIARVVVLSGENLPIAERTIYISPSNLNVTIVTDSQEYHPRSKVQVRIHVSAENGDPVRGIFAFSSSMAARIRSTNVPDITQPALFTPLPRNSNIILPPAGYPKDDDALDQVLISKLADYLRWEDIVKDTVRWLYPRSSDNYGYVRRKDKRLKTPVGISLFGQKVSSIRTDSSGAFEIPDSLLVAPFGTDPGAAVSGVGLANQGDYQLYVFNRCDTITRTLAATCVAPIILTAGNELEAPEDRNTPFERAKTLAVATVTAHQDEDEQISSSGDCLDWVCPMNILNCRNPNHKVGRKPVVGEVLRWYGPTAPADGKIVYKHCMSCRKCTVDHVQGFLSTIPAIHRPGEFFDMDSVKFDPQRPAVYSTLFWEPFVITDEKGEANFYFYTNDIKGRFYNRLQGWSPAGTYKGQSVFRVLE